MTTAPQEADAAGCDEVPNTPPHNDTTTLERLPVEIIDIIAFFVRQDPNAAVCIAQRRKHCPCILQEQEKTTKSIFQDVEPNDQYRDPALNLSMVCRRLRQIVFDNLFERNIRGGLCHRSWEKTSRRPEHLRNAVKSLEIQTRPQHTPSSPHIAINDYICLLPSLERLHINWTFPIIGIASGARTAACLATHLTLAMQCGTSSMTQSSAELIALQLPRLLGYLTLPDLRSLVLQISMTSSSFGDEEENWFLLARAMVLLSKFDTLKELTFELRIFADIRGHVALYLKLRHIMAVISATTCVKTFHLNVEFEFDGRSCHPFSDNADGTIGMSSRFMINEARCHASYEGMIEFQPALERFGLSITATLTPRTAARQHYRLLSFKRDKTGVPPTTAYAYRVDALLQMYDAFEDLLARRPLPDSLEDEDFDETDPEEDSDLEGADAEEDVV